MSTINLQRESKFIHSHKINTFDKESLLFRLLDIAQTTLSNYANSETKKLKSFYKIVYLKTKDFILKKSNPPSRKATEGQVRGDVKIGGEVEIILKQDQRTGKLTRGIVAEILTSSSFHPHGIKVRLENGQVGRVQNIL